MGILDIFRKKPELAKDPVCHMSVDVAKARVTSQFEGETFYFCAPGCKVAFEKEPEKYLSGDAEEAPQQHNPPEPPKVSFIGRLFGRK